MLQMLSNHLLLWKLQWNLLYFIHRYLSQGSRQLWLCHICDDLFADFWLRDTISIENLPDCRLYFPALKLISDMVFCTDSLKLPSFEFIYLLDSNHFNCSDYVHFFNIISQWTLSTQRQPHTAEMELISYSIPTYWQWRGIAGAEKLKIFRSLWTELTRLGGKFLCENLLFFWAWYFS